MFFNSLCTSSDNHLPFSGGFSAKSKILTSGNPAFPYLFFNFTTSYFFSKTFNLVSIDKVAEHKIIGILVSFARTIAISLAL